jgi:hypothetical protein
MTGLAVVQSSMLGVVGNGATSVPMAAAGSLALAVFRNSRDAKNNDNNANLHAPNRRRKHDGSSSTSRNDNKPSSSSDSDSDSDNPMIQLYQKWMTLPQIFRFGVAGNLGNLGFFYLEKVIFRLLSHVLVTTSVLSSALMDGIEKYQDGMSFFSAYVILIVLNHILYAFLVYGMDTIGTWEKYSKTLLGQFKVYGFGLFGATFLNSFLIKSGGLGKTAAFIATTATFAVFNYYLVSRVVQNAIESSAKDPVVKDGRDQGKLSRRR